MKSLKDILASNPAVNHQLPAPRVVEAIDDVINLDVPFTLELPALSASYTTVLLVIANNDGTYSPSATVEGDASSGEPVRGSVDNSQLNPPFTRDHYAVVQALVRLQQSDIWELTPDSVTYTFG